MMADPKKTAPLRVVQLSVPVTVTRAELEWARTHPLNLFDQMILDHVDATRRRSP